MKVISLTQPWASLVLLGAKRIETRTWGTHYRGPIAIHASKEMPRDFRTLAATEPFSSVLAQRNGDLPRGCVLCVTSLLDVQELVARDDAKYVVERYGAEHEWDFGNYERGRFAWILGPVTLVLTPPVYVKGKLGLWDWDSAVRVPA